MPKSTSTGFACLLVLLSVASPAAAENQAGNLLADPSFEITKPKDQFGLVFARWGGWKYEGDCDFRVGEVARTGRHSCLLYGGAGPKIRVSQDVELEPGRYRISAFLRGLDIGKGTYGATTEFMFDGKYLQLNKNGTFGWTKLTYVGEIDQKKKAGPSFGLMAPGYFWIERRLARARAPGRAVDREAGARARRSSDRSAGRADRQRHSLLGMWVPK